jgi:hypothetical protein
MKKTNLIGVIILAMAILFPGHTLFAAQQEALISLSWDGKDGAGKIEQSLPVTITVFDADSLIALSSASVDGPVTDYAMPPFSVTVEDNQDRILKVFAVAKDSQGNESGQSDTVSVTLTGKDTVGPGVPVIRITVQ